MHECEVWDVVALVELCLDCFSDEGLLSGSLFGGSPLSGGGPSFGGFPGGGGRLAAGTF